MRTPIRPRRRRFKPKPKLERRLRVNFQIRVPEIRLIDDTGKQVGVIPTTRGFELARDRGLDLVEVNPVAEPPICKLLNWGAFQYQQEKLERKSRVKQHKIEIKGIRLSLKIGKHDLDLRREQAMRFFERGDKVKIELILRGRERQHEDRARTIVNDFIASLGSGAFIEQPMTKQGGRMSLLIAWRGEPPKMTSPETDEAADGEESEGDETMTANGSHEDSEPNADGGQQLSPERPTV